MVSTAVNAAVVSCVAIAKTALRGALRSIASKGGGTVDGYPIAVPREKPYSSSFLWSGTESMFAAQGFRALFAENPGDGIRYIALSAPVGTHYCGNAFARKLQFRAVTEGLESENLKPF
jgi:hypothetical protein